MHGNLRKILRALLALGLTVYLVFATLISRGMASNDLCKGMSIVVNDTSATPFVTSRELARELHGLPARAAGMRLSSIDTDSLRAMLSRIDKIEHVNVTRRSDGTILISVDPMRPVARIFDGSRSYYINRQGKRIGADARYHVDVPVIDGHFDDASYPAVRMLPLLDWIADHKRWNEAVSMIIVEDSANVLLLPAFRGQVINLGSADPATFDDKFKRLNRFYDDIVPVKGWNFYDTISVKWSGQVVATRRNKKLLDTGYVVEEENDDIDVSTMRVGESVAPGQAIPGQKAKDDKHIPKAGAKRQKPTPERPDSSSKTE